MWILLKSNLTKIIELSKASNVYIKIFLILLLLSSIFIAYFSILSNLFNILNPLLQKTNLTNTLEIFKVDNQYNAGLFLQYYSLSFSFSIFFIGIAGIIFNRKNLINVMISIELMLLGGCLNFIFFSIFLNSALGQMFALFVIAIAAADSAIGLGILVAAFYLKRNIAFDNFSFLKG